jgi:hypothetical protein
MNADVSHGTMEVNMATEGTVPSVLRVVDYNSTSERGRLEVSDGEVTDTCRVYPMGNYSYLFFRGKAWRVEVTGEFGEEVFRIRRW